MIEQIERYLKNNQGSLVGISDLAKHVNQQEGKVFLDLISLQESGKVTICRVYVCNKQHQISQDLRFCPICDRDISEEEIRVLVFARSIC